MTLADEARELLEDERRALDALAAVRREIDEAMEAGQVRDEATAGAWREQLEKARERVRRVQAARRDLGAVCS